MSLIIDTLSLYFSYTFLLLILISLFPFKGVYYYQVTVKKCRLHTGYDADAAENVCTVVVAVVVVVVSWSSWVVVVVVIILVLVSS